MGWSHVEPRGWHFRPEVSRPQAAVAEVKGEQTAWSRSVLMEGLPFSPQTLQRQMLDKICSSSQQLPSAFELSPS